MFKLTSSGPELKEKCEQISAISCIKFIAEINLSRNCFVFVRCNLTGYIGFFTDHVLVSGNGTMYIELGTDETPGGRGFHMAVTLSRKSSNVQTITLRETTTLALYYNLHSQK